MKTKQDFLRGISLISDTTDVKATRVGNKPPSGEGLSPEPERILPVRFCYVPTRSIVSAMDNLDIKLRECAAASLAGVAITSPEEDEVISRVCEFAVKTAPYLSRDGGNPRRVYVWHQSTGFRRYGLYERQGENLVPVETMGEEDDRTLACRPLSGDENTIECDDYDDIFAFIRDYDPKASNAGAIFVLCDWHNYIGSSPNLEPSTLDAQKVLLSETSKAGSNKTVIMLSPQRWNIPVELEQVIRVIDLPLPDKEDIVAKVNYYVDYFRDNLEAFPDKRPVAEMSEREIEELADACAGLTLFQMENTLLMSLASCDGRFDREFILREKREMMKNQGIELIEPKFGYDDVGGLEPAKAWARRYRNRFTQAAFDYGFTRYPRGMFMTGIPGCGKSLMSSVLCQEWGMNGIRIKASDLKGSLVGESEQKTDNIIKMAEANAPCLLVVDEAEKMFASTDASRDGGASQGVLSLFLTFMQESQKGVFVVFTLNNMSALPRELIDRFEGRFFFDLPSASERADIFNIHISRFNRDPANYDIEDLVSKTDGFNGRGIEAAVAEAFGAAFADDGREPTNDDFVTAFDVIGPAADQKTIESLREEAKAKQLMTANRPKPASEQAKAEPMDFSRI